MNNGIQYINDEGWKITFTICLFGRTFSQLLSNLDPWEYGIYSNFEGWCLTLVAYKKVLPFANKLSLIRPAMLIQVLGKNELDVTYNALSTYFKRSQTHLLTVKHFHIQVLSYCKLAVHALSLDHWYLSCSTCCKIHSSVETLSRQTFFSYPYTRWIYSSLFHKLK